MKKKKSPPTEFKFWKDNRIDQEFTMTVGELKEKYLAFLKTKEDDWITYYGHQTVVYFVNSREGLDSIMEQDQVAYLEDLLVNVRHSLPCYQTKK